MIDLQKQDNVFVLRMQNGENRLNPTFLDAFNRALDQVEQSKEPAALVTVGEGKFYSNGLDLEWMASVSPKEALASTRKVHALLGRMLAFPAITVAACNGHVFAAGAMLALGHDFRVMRADRGYFCLPEADIQIPFTPAMSALIRARLPVWTSHEAMVSAKRYTAEEALQRKIIDVVAPEAAVLGAALEIAKANANKHRPTLATIKRTAYAPVLELLAKHATEES